MADPRSFADLVAATARQKLAAANARQNPDVAAEKPREAIFNALQMVAEAIGVEGFAFTPSGPNLLEGMVILRSRSKYNPIAITWLDKELQSGCILAFILSL